VILWLLNRALRWFGFKLVLQRVVMMPTGFKAISVKQQ